VERLEDRTLPSSYTAATVADLIADINAANQGGGANTITLAAKKTFNVQAVNNTTDGPTGLTVITLSWYLWIRPMYGALLVLEPLLERLNLVVVLVDHVLQVDFGPGRGEELFRFRWPAAPRH
jgi:hypothetical protein